MNFELCATFESWVIFELWVTFKLWVTFELRGWGTQKQTDGNTHTHTQNTYSSLQAPGALESVKLEDGQPPDFLFSCFEHLFLPTSFFIFSATPH